MCMLTPVHSHITRRLSLGKRPSWSPFICYNQQGARNVDTSISVCPATHLVVCEGEQDIPIM